MNIRCWDELAKYGAVDVLRREYGSLYLATPEPDYHVSLAIDLEQIPPEGGTRSATTHVGGVLTIFLSIRGQRSFHQFHCASQEERSSCAVRTSLQRTKTIGEFWI